MQKHHQEVQRRISRNVQYVALMLLFSTACIFSQTATATINFGQLTGQTIKKGAFGLNLYQGFNPDVQANASYKDGLSYMKPGHLRYHQWGMLDQYNAAFNNGWLNGTAWYAPKINTCLSNTFDWGPDLLMNIPKWPGEWSDANGRLATSHYTDFADWCASLVKIVNIDQGHGFKYWEITNEQDEGYENNNAELGRIFNQAAAAMKAVDPSIKCGGLAFARPDKIYNLDGFFSTAAPNLDFISYHSYATGNAGADLGAVWNQGVNGGNIVRSVKAEFAKYSTRTIEYFHNEHNISWAPPDAKQTDSRGMIFDALMMTTAIKAGATGTMAWNECDGWYGKMDGSYNKRPSAYLYHSLNNAGLIGAEVCNTTVSDEGSIAVLAATKNKVAQFVVINRTFADANFKFSFTGLSGSITSSSLFTRVLNTSAGGEATSPVTFGELTSGTGVLCPQYTVSIFSITLDSLSTFLDTTAPTVPMNLRCSSTNSSISLVWDPSTDNVAVTGYDLFLNSKLYRSIGGTINALVFPWLDAATTYTLSVKAKDANGNESPLSSPLTAKTLSSTTGARPSASVFMPTSWTNSFSGNVINDAGQTVSSDSRSILKQNEELQLVLSNLPQWAPLYQSTFTRTINLSGNSTFTVDIKSDKAFSMRVKVGDAAGNMLDSWQNTLSVSGDNTSHTYTLDFASFGFASVSPATIKTIVFMYPDGTVISGTVYLDNIRLGTNGDVQAPSSPTPLSSTAQTDKSISLSWDAATDNIGVTGYDVFNGDLRTNTSPITATTYTITGLSAATPYVFTVKANDAAGNVSPASNSLMVSTADSATSAVPNQCFSLAGNALLSVQGKTVILRKGQIADISICNVRGELVRHATVGTSGNILSLGDLGAGIYLLKVRSGRQSEQRMVSIVK